MVIVEAPRGISPIPGNIDVIGARREHQCIERKVSLQEAAMGLGLEFLHYLIYRPHLHVDPRRVVAGGYDALDTGKNQLPDYLLGPGGSRLGVGVNYDVAVAEPELVPAR